MCVCRALYIPRSRRSVYTRRASMRQCPIMAILPLLLLFVGYDDEDDFRILESRGQTQAERNRVNLLKGILSFFCCFFFVLLNSTFPAVTNLPRYSHVTGHCGEHSILRLSMDRVLLSIAANNGVLWPNSRFVSRRFPGSDPLHSLSIIARTTHNSYPRAAIRLPWPFWKRANNAILKINKKESWGRMQIVFTTIRIDGRALAYIESPFPV